MNEVHLVLPRGYDDPGRPSGGNTYDREVVSGLTDLGWAVVVHEVADSWPTAAATVVAAVAAELAGIADERVVVVDGLLGTAAAAELVRAAHRLRLVALVHMPGPPGGPPREVLDAVRLVVTTSEWTARTLVDEHDATAGQLVVAPPGVRPVSPSAGRPTRPATGSALLCVAAVTRAKGHDVLFRALARLASRDWTCVCAGDLDREPEFVEEQRRFLADRGISGRVHLTGVLAGPDLEQAYARADLAVLPTRLESYGLVVTEALAHGLPVVTADVGGVPEALGTTEAGRRPGLLVAPGDDQALGQAIAAWLDDPDLRSALRAAARERREQLTGWERTAATISAALSRLDRR